MKDTSCRFCQTLIGRTRIKNALEEKFRVDINNKGDKVDPNADQDWYSLTLGYAIGKGLSVESAHAFALHIRYHTMLG